MAERKEGRRVVRSKDDPTAPWSLCLRVVGGGAALPQSPAVKCMCSGGAGCCWSKKEKQPFRVEIEDAGNFADDRPRGPQGFRIWGRVGDGLRTGSTQNDLGFGSQELPQEVWTSRGD